MSSAKPTVIHCEGLVVIIVALGLFAPYLSTAQSFRGSIRGKVLDPSGSLIAGAKIAVKNDATGLTRDTRSGPDGGYVVAELPAGTYRVTAESAGLSSVSQNVLVDVGLDTAVDFRLTKVEEKLEQLTVTASAPVVETGGDVLGEVVERDLVANLPLNGRDFGKLVALVPGATVEPSGVAAIQSGFGQFSINGNRDRSNNYELDGSDNNDPFFNNSAFNQTGIGGAPASILPIDAIQEFNLQSQFPAEYGRNSGSVINIISKSGTNLFHGSAFEFLRNNVFDARNYFNRRPAPMSAFRNNQFGGSLGGPVVKSRTFFFAAYEGQRERVGSDFTLLVPTPSQIASAQTIALANGVTPSPALSTILGFFPAPTGFNGQTGTVAGNVKDKNDVDSLLAKVDHQISSSESFSGRYAYASSQQVFPLGGLGSLAASRLPQFAQQSPTRVQLVSGSLLSTFGLSRVNEVRFGYSRYRTSFTARDSNFDPSSLGIDFGTGKTGLPEIDFGGIFDNLGATAFSVPRGRTSRSFQLLDNFTIAAGRHSLKFGGEYRRALIDNFNDNLERGGIVFAPNNGFCNTPGVCNDPGTDILAAYYLGFDSFTLANSGNTQRTTSNNGAAFFVQDDFRARPHLILNLGLRWEYFGPISESHNLLANLGRDGNLAMVGMDGVNGAYNRDLNNFGPRFGFAWTLHPTTVIRGGYGIYHDYIPQDLMIANFTNDAGLITPPIGPRPVQPLTFNSSAFNGSQAGAPVFSPVIQPFPFDIFFTPRNLVTPYAQNWNLNIEQELARNVGLQLGYVGSKGTKLVRLRDANQALADGTRPNPNYGFMDEFANLSSSTYHAFQGTLRVHGSHGISGFAGYTWSKSLDDASDGIDFNSATVALPQDSNNLKAEHGPSNFDTRHRFTAAFSYRIPRLIGPEQLAGGWQLNTIFTAQSGRPIPIVSSSDTSGFSFPTPANSHQRPDLVPGISPINPDWESAPDSIGYLNPLAFAQPPSPTGLAGSFGDLGRNAIFGPHFWDLDFALAKDTRLLERLNLELRAEFFNIFNHPNFALPNWFVNPGAGITAPPATGLITQTPDQAQTNPGLGGGGPRVIQLGLKLLF
ncbi:MAG: TonB-dependent receptor [Acidobacteria bacterium]|nr:TonB-dependent receptor [Acidobacteriota bacterium]